jgi:hypothetical protein
MVVALSLLAAGVGTSRGAAAQALDDEYVVAPGGRFRRDKEQE